MTGRTAAAFGILGRGVIRPDTFGDLMVFGPATIIDSATFDEPTRPAQGIEEIWVNGQAAYRAGRNAIGAQAGRIITCAPV